MNKQLLPTENINRLDNLLLVIFSLYPITFLIGNFAINFFLFAINVVFILGFFKNQHTFKILNKYILNLLLFLFLVFCINLYFSNSFQLSYPRVLKFILIIGSILSFRKLVITFKNENLQKLYKTWSIIFSVVLIDIVFELIFNFNILGFTSFMPGRIASFSGNELNIGHYFSAFCLIFLSYIYLNTKIISINIIFSLCLIIVSFLIGERSNFIKTLIIISIFALLIYETNIKYKIFAFLGLIIVFISVLNINSSYKVRYVEQFTKILTKNGINFYLDNTIYGAHYNVAKEIFKDNKIFGVGIKNFRIESFSKKYKNLDHPENDKRGNTHPHQIHYELLAETGLVGYLGFLIFILFSLHLSMKTYLKKKNLYQLSAIFFVIISLLPLLPSGSFFSTYTSGLFWLQYSIMVGYVDR